MPSIKWFLIFLFLNFAGLALGSYLMAGGPNGSWYLGLEKAPWTPPGWAFGVAWTSIMVLYSLFLGYWLTADVSARVWIFIAVAWVLNVAWNGVFFQQHWVLLGLFILLLLTALLVYMFFLFDPPTVQWPRLLLLPYIGWMLVAISMNGYIYLYN
jgi:tryptophan-rich sensory protein